MPAGWADGEGEVLDGAGLQLLAKAFETNFPAQHKGVPLPIPFLYPTLEGGVLAEWCIDIWAVFLEISLPSLDAEFCALNLADETDECHSLKLTPEASVDWGRLADLLATRVATRIARGAP